MMSEKKDLMGWPSEKLHDGKCPCIQVGVMCPGKACGVKVKGCAYRLLMQCDAVQASKAIKRIRMERGISYI